MTAVRDVAIIVLAVESIIVGILLGILTIQVYKLVKLLREEVKPMLEATQETVGTHSRFPQRASGITGSEPGWLRLRPASGGQGAG